MTTQAPPTDQSAASQALLERLLGDTVASMEAISVYLGLSVGSLRCSR
ncbi:MAG: hypothetical protein ACR2G7_09175 [Acidimicrobiales bacterium]